MVGRAEELQRLGQALERAAAGHGGAVVVAGEAGVGKTRLLTEFVASRRAEATVLVGGCLDLADGAPPYWAVVDALRGLAHRSGDEALAGVLGPGRSPLSILLPELAGTDGDSIRSGEAARQAGEAARRAQDQLFELVLSVLEQASEARPVVLTVEDLHWSDRSTRDLLTFLVGNLRSRPFLFLATYRSDALVPGMPSTAGWPSSSAAPAPSYSSS